MNTVPLPTMSCLKVAELPPNRPLLMTEPRATAFGAVVAVAIRPKEAALQVRQAQHMQQGQAQPPPGGAQRLSQAAL
jgi:hypothetical protein